MSLDAYQILAKHDENYVPKEVKRLLKNDSRNRFIIFSSSFSFQFLCLW